MRRYDTKWDDITYLMLCHIVSCCVILSHFVSYRHRLILCHIVSFCVISSNFESYRLILCHVVNKMTRFDTKWDDMTQNETIWHKMRQHHMSYFVSYRKQNETIWLRIRRYDTKLDDITYLILCHIVSCCVISSYLRNNYCCCPK